MEQQVTHKDQQKNMAQRGQQSNNEGTGPLKKNKSVQKQSKNRRNNSRKNKVSGNQDQPNRRNSKNQGKAVEMTEFRQPLQVQSHLEMPRILVQLGHTQRTWKLAPQTDPKWSPTWSLTRFQPIYPLSARDGRYACQVSRAHRTHSRL